VATMVRTRITKDILVMLALWIIITTAVQTICLELAPISVISRKSGTGFVSAGNITIRSHFHTLSTKEDGICIFGEPNTCTLLRFGMLVKTIDA
jgi:hypothetical protein